MVLLLPLWSERNPGGVFNDAHNACLHYGVIISHLTLDHVYAGALELVFIGRDVLCGRRDYPGQLRTLQLQCAGVLCRSGHHGGQSEVSI